MSFTQRAVLAISLAAAPMLALCHEADSPSALAAGHLVFTASAWGDSEHLADREAGLDAATVCRKANGTVASVRTQGTRMLGNGTWQATAEVICRES
ncbi:hypothetical protein [Pinirhizobacter sp.]|uniref:hypothetical protein n=1 Tax=Pinirhizobacter sp. TaxID=2950432 RepID=UPI002F404087